MDIYRMLDLTEELLNMYGYEVQRGVGVVGMGPTTAELAKEPVEVKTEQQPGLVYELDMMGEKKDIERPFGRVAVLYKRGGEKLSNIDVRHLYDIMLGIDAHYGMYLTNTGYTGDAAGAAGNLKIEIITPERLEQLIGKVTVEQPWWQGYPAFKPLVSYEESLYQLRYYLEHVFHWNWDIVWIMSHELAYMPYWKFTYYIEKKEGRRQYRMDQYEGYHGINAQTGAMDFELHAKPDDVMKVHPKGASQVLGMEAVNRHFRDFRSKLIKVHKPEGLPKHVKFTIYKPALTKHEAKIAAQQYMSKWKGVPPEEVIVTGRELIFIPYWRAHVFIRPYVKNIHNDTIHFQLMNTAVYTNAFNYFTQHDFLRPWPHFYCEKLLVRLMGADNFIKFMRSTTFTIARLWWTFNLTLTPNFMKVSWLTIELLLLYTFYVTVTPLSSAIFSFLATNLVLIPFHALMYILTKHTRVYPSEVYAHPKSTGEKRLKPYWKGVETKDKAQKALEHLEMLEKSGKLSEETKKELAKLRHQKAEGLLKGLEV